MQTFPCGHRVVCRKCFVKTIQMAVSQRLLPLRCVICRAKILRLKQLTPSNRAFGTSSSSNSHQYQQQEFSSAIFPAPYANKLPEAGDVCQRVRKPHFGHPYANASSVSRANFRQRIAAVRSPALLPIPETEELELVNTVQEQEQVLCPDFGNSDDEWSEKDDLKAELKAKDPLEKMDHFQVVRWFSKFKRFKPPSILKGIKNRWKK